MNLINKKYNFLTPIKFPNKILKRFGRLGDGGYVCEDKLVKDTKILVTFGMGPDWTFELDCIKVNPDIRILGADHEGTKFTGYELSSIKTVFNSRDHGYSTSELRRRVYEAEKKK